MVRSAFYDTEIDGRICYHVIAAPTEVPSAFWRRREACANRENKPIKSLQLNDFR